MNSAVSMGSMSCNESSGYRFREKQIRQFTNSEFLKLFYLENLNSDCI